MTTRASNLGRGTRWKRNPPTTPNTSSAASAERQPGVWKRSPPSTPSASAAASSELKCSPPATPSTSAAASAQRQPGVWKRGPPSTPSASASAGSEQSKPSVLATLATVPKLLDKWNFAAAAKQHVAQISSSGIPDIVSFRNMGEKRILIEEAKHCKLYFEVDDVNRTFTGYSGKPTAPLTGYDLGDSNDLDPVKGHQKKGKGKSKGKGNSNPDALAMMCRGSRIPGLDGILLHSAAEGDCADSSQCAIWRCYPFEIWKDLDKSWHVAKGFGSQRKTLMSSSRAGDDVIEAFAGTCEIKLHCGSDVPRSREETLSRLLSSTLRHKATEQGLSVQPDGYVLVNDLLQSKKYSKWQPPITLDELQWLAAVNAKQRYELAQDEHMNWKIRATQGHTMKSIQDEALLEGISSADLYPLVVHGTYSALLERIVSSGQGLKAMGRNHIHFTTTLPNADKKQGAVSGMRDDVDVAIVIDLAMALEHEIPFFRSSNGVLLTPGISADGCSERSLPTRYFKSIIDLTSGEPVGIKWSTS